MLRLIVVLLCLHVMVFAIDITRYEKGASKGDVKSMIVLGKLYYSGKDIPQDYKKSLYYFSKAAAKGNNHAKVMLSLLYQNGYGVKKNLLMWIKLLKDAAKNGNKLAKEWIESLGDMERSIKFDQSKIAKSINKSPNYKRLYGIKLGEPFRDELMNLKYNGHSFNDGFRKVFLEVEPKYANEDISNIRSITVFTSVLSNIVYEIHVKYKEDVKDYFSKFGNKKIHYATTKLMPFEQKDRVSYVDFDVVNSPFKKDAFFRIADINNLDGIRHIVRHNKVVVIDFSALALATMEAIENNSYFGEYIAKKSGIDERYRSMFGVSLMDSLDSSLKPEDISIDSRWDWYSIRPSKSNSLFEKYRVKTTFFTKRIYDISASGKVAGIGGDERCGKAVDKLLKNFTKTFSNAKSNQLYNNLKSKKYANFNIDKNGVTKDSPSKFSSKSVSVGLSCNTNKKGEWFINLDMKSYYGKEIGEIENCLLSHNSDIWDSLNCKILIESYRRK